MVLPGSNVSLGLIQGEFGGVTPISLIEYYAGGLYVPSGTSGIPTAGLISFSNFLGKSNVFSLLQGNLIRRYFANTNSSIASNTTTMDSGFNNTSSDGGFIHASDFLLPPGENYCMEYTGWLTVGTTGSYTFGLRSDDGSDFAMWIGSAWSIVSSAYGNKPLDVTPPNPGTRSLTAGVAYPIRIRYHEYTGNESLFLEWKPLAATTFTNIPFTVFSCNGITPITATTIRQGFPAPWINAVVNFDANSLSSTYGIDTEIISWQNSGSLTTSAAGNGTTTKPRLRKLGNYYHVEFNRANNNYFTIPELLFTWFNVGGIYNGLTVFVVAQFTNIGHFERFMDFSSGQGNNNIWFGRNESQNRLGGNIWNGTSEAVNNNGAFTENSNFHIFTMHVTNTSSGGTNILYCDSVTTALSTLNFATPIANRTSTQNYIGRSAWATDAYLNANMRQLLIYNTALTQADLSTVYSELKTKWGL
jgi:hypothetical protein